MQRLAAKHPNICICLTE